MNGPITWEQVVTLLGTGGAIVGIWYRLQSQVTANKAHHDSDLAKYKLHIAETYVTKAGMSEQTAQIMKAIDGVGVKIDRTNDRLDGLTQLKVTRSRQT